MKQYHGEWTKIIVQTLEAAYPDLVTEDIPALINPETPPDQNLGDIAFPLFPLARILKKSPAEIAQTVASQCVAPEGARVAVQGPYVNIFLNRSAVAAHMVNTVLQSTGEWGNSAALAGQRIMIEFSCPNTNKPLHLGHLRNDALGESVARIIAAAGGTVRRVNLINDRGIHICKSMAAYERFGEGSTPESTGKKSDHFVGDYYVRYAQWEKEDPAAEERAREMLRLWEEDDPAIMELWRQMNGWAIGGIEETYQRTGIHFDHVYYESNTYTLGRERILAGLEDGVFYRDEKGTVWVDLTDIQLDRKVLLRADGTSLYLTQDIGTAIQRHEDWPFDSLIYVVASEQRYHFQVLFEVLRRLGMEWAPALHHLAYGMVNLPDGRMKSREGTVVDADELIDTLQQLALAEIHGKERAAHLADPAATAEQIALGALHYYLLQTGPVKDMVFNAEESLAFTGNTGPYLQYVGARVHSMLRRQDAPDTVVAPTQMEEDEWRLIHQLGEYPRVVADAARGYNPALVAGHLYETAKTFSRFYHDHPIVVAEDPAVRSFRLGLSRAVMEVMKHGLQLLNIPFLEGM